MDGTLFWVVHGPNNTKARDSIAVQSRVLCTGYISNAAGCFSESYHLSQGTVHSRYRNLSSRPGENCSQHMPPTRKQSVLLVENEQHIKRIFNIQNSRERG